MNVIAFFYGVAQNVVADVIVMEIVFIFQMYKH